MPSGAKKRKAAKRKKELASHQHPSPNQGSEVLDSQECENPSSKLAAAAALDKTIQILENGKNEYNNCNGDNNEEKDSTLKTEEEGLDSREYIQTVKELTGDSSSEDGSSGSSSEEGSRSVETLSEKESPKSADVVAIPAPTIASIQQRVSLAEEFNQVTEESVIALDLPLARRSPWTSCCGLFELLMGSTT